MIDERMKWYRKILFTHVHILIVTHNTTVSDSRPHSAHLLRDRPLCRSEILHCTVGILPTTRGLGAYTRKWKHYYHIKSVHVEIWCLTHTLQLPSIKRSIYPDIPTTLDRHKLCHLYTRSHTTPTYLSPVHSSFLPQAVSSWGCLEC